MDPQSRLKLPLQVSMPAAADQAFDRFAELVRTVIGVPVALVTLVDQQRQIFPGASGLKEPLSSERTSPLSHSFCQHVVLQAGPLIISDAREDDRVSDNLAIRDLGVIAYAGMPLVDGSNEVIGSLCAIDNEPRIWAAGELKLLSDLAAACSAEFQLREAVKAAAAAYERTQLLMDLSQALSATTTVADISRAVATIAHSHLNSDFGGIALLDELRSTLSYVDSDEFTDSMRRHTAKFSVDAETPSAVAVRTGTPQFFATVEELILIAPSLAEAARACGGQSFAYLPLRTAGRVLGSIAIFWTQPHRITSDDRDILASFAGYTAQALFRAQLLAERRDVARVFQESLVPELLELPGVEMAARYIPANVTDQVGGDWYDAFCVDGSTMVFSVGDVTGHDTAAAAAMGQLRASLRTLVIDRPAPPEQILNRLDRLMALAVHGRLATAVLATMTPTESGVQFTWSNAGHLPPLLLVPGSPGRFLSADPDPLLGLRGPSTRHSHTCQLPSGSIILLYTDGLVEQRGEIIDNGLAALLDTAESNRHQSLEGLLQSLISESLAQGHEDDTVMFAVRVL